MVSYVSIIHHTQISIDANEYSRKGFSIMLTYSFENKGSESLYEYLYKLIKNDILNGSLSPDEKLPSKRALAKHLSISTITVENTYSQLCAEGYLYSVPKSGFYVSDITSRRPISMNKPERIAKVSYESPKYFADFVNNSTSTDTFPFATWTKLLRETMSENADKLMARSPSAGIMELRSAIADYLYQFRGMLVDPEQIVIGAGTEYLYGLIIQLLGRDKKYAIEDPGYQKIAKIYRANEVSFCHISMDKNGISIEELQQSKADILHISPTHHFPTGIVTPINRRYELLSWANDSAERYIIEDDYDSEFRLQGKPIPSLHSIDSSEKVIYMNTFSKSLTSTIRISYMVLPKSLLERYQKELSFYSCTVSNFEQYTLAKFIEKGYLEKHINRMRNYYRTLRDTLLTCIKNQPGFSKVTILEEDAGLHFLLKVDTSMSDRELIHQASLQGIHISCLSQYFYAPTALDTESFSLSKGPAQNTHILIINYSGICLPNIEEAIERLFFVLRDRS